MLTGKQKAIYLTAGGTAAATLVWLRYAKSAAGTRSFLRTTGGKARRALGEVQTTVSALQRRVEETDRLLHAFARLGSEQKTKAEVVINDTLKRLEQTADLVQRNLVESSTDIATLLKEIRIALKQSVGTKSPQAA